jgi:hypothetical protein
MVMPRELPVAVVVVLVAVVVVDVFVVLVPVPVLVLSPPLQAASSATPRMAPYLRSPESRGSDLNRMNLLLLMARVRARVVT